MLTFNVLIKFSSLVSFFFSDEEHDLWFNQELSKKFYESKAKNLSFLFQAQEEEENDIDPLERGDYSFDSLDSIFKEQSRPKRRRVKRCVRRNFLLKFTTCEVDALGFVFQEWCFSTPSTVYATLLYPSYLSLKNSSLVFLANFLILVSFTWKKRFSLHFVGAHKKAYFAESADAVSYFAYSFFGLGFISRILKLNVVLCSGAFFPFSRSRVYPYEVKVVLGSAPEISSFFGANFEYGFFSLFPCFESFDFLLLRGLVYKDFLELPTHRPLWAVSLTNASTPTLFSYIRLNLDVVLDVFKILPYKNLPSYLLRQDSIVFNIFKQNKMILTFGFVDIKCFFLVSLVVVVGSKKKFLLGFICDKPTRWVSLVYVPYAADFIKLGSIATKMRSLVLWKHIQHLFSTNTIFYLNFELLTRYSTTSLADSYTRVAVPPTLSWYHKTLASLPGFRGLRKFFNNRKLRHLAI